MYLYSLMLPIESGSKQCSVSIYSYTVLVALTPKMADRSDRSALKTDKHTK